MTRVAEGPRSARMTNKSKVERHTVRRETEEPQFRISSERIGSGARSREKETEREDVLVFRGTAVKELWRLETEGKIV